MKEKIVTHASHAKLQYYRHNYCLVTMTGVLGCRWHRYQQSTRDSRKRDFVNFFIVLLAFLYIVLFFIFWLVATNDEYYIAVDMFQRVGTYIPWYGLGLGFSSATFAYLSVILFLCVLHVIHGHQLFIHLSHVVISVLVIAACVLFSVLIDVEWPRMWPLLYISLKVFGPFILLTAVIVLTFLSWLLIRQWFRLMSKTAKAIWVSVFVGGMLALYLCPLAIDTPIFRPDTPPKPAIVALGGASHVAPENTMFAFKKAVDLGATRIFTTVQISYDGVPFLMSDNSLERTTNADEILPNRTSNDPSRCNISELLSLSAGSWFIQDDPWDNSGELSKQERSELSTEKVPTLSALADYAAQTEGVELYLTVRKLPSWHPYRHMRFQVVVDTLNGHALLKHSNVYIPGEAYRLDTRFGLLAETSSPIWQEIDSGHVTNTNLSTVYLPVRTDMGSVIQRFRDRNTSVLVLDVNSAWFLSYVWCADTHLIATYYVRDMQDVGGPIIHLNEDGYLALWVTCDVLSIAAILVMFIVQRVRLYGTNFSPEAISLSTGRVRTSHRSRTMKEKLLREGAVMDTLDDTEASGAGGPAGVDLSEADNSYNTGSAVDAGPSYSRTSGQQAYSLTTTPGSLGAGAGVVGGRRATGSHHGHHHHHHMTGSASDGEVGLSPPVASLDRYSV